jgi:uncharacterized membrane protein
MTLEHSIGRLLTVATIAGVIALSVGVVAMIAAGLSPIGSSVPPFDLASLGSRIARLEPGGLLWIGLVVVIATPPLRVAAALVGYASRGDRRMALVSAGILTVIALGIVVGVVEA